MQRYQKGLEEKMRESEFIFDSVGLLCYKIHKCSLNGSDLYVDSSKWLKKQKRNNKY